MAKEKVEICKDCKHWIARINEKEPVPTGYCHGTPPSTFPSSDFQSIVTQWPITLEHEFCGCFKKRGTK